MMKTSEIKPTAWKFALSNPKINILMRKWNGTRENVVHMEETLLKLMENPQSTPEQLAMAAKLYTSVTQKLTDCANAIDDYLYHGIKPESPPHQCIFCGSTEPLVENEGAWPYCPECKGQ